MLSAIFLLRRRIHASIHQSILIAFWSVGFISGIAVTRGIPPGLFLSVAWVVLAAAVTTVGFWRHRSWCVIIVIAAGAIGGLWRGSLVNADLMLYKPLYGSVVTLSGVAHDDPDSSSGTLIVKLTDVKINGQSYGGSVWVSTSPHDIKRSDHIIVSGKLGIGFGTFAGVMYRASILKVMRVVGADPARDVRDWFASAIKRAIPEPEASLGVGYLVGQKSALPTDLAAAFVTTGLTQAVVASGYNLTILVRLARRLFSRVSRYVSAISASGMVVAFMAVTGLSPSMTRAGIVSGVSLLTWYYGRSVHPLILLLFAATVTLMYNPSYAWGDLGWALSFSAFAAVMLVAPLCHAYFFGEAPPGLVRGLLVETVAATIVTLPILAVSFGQFSNVSLPASLLVLPLIPLAMLLTFVAGIGALIAAPFATILGMPATWILSYSIGVAKYFAGLDWATSQVSVSPFIMVIAYVLIAGACLYMRRMTHASVGTPSLL